MTHPTFVNLIEGLCRDYGLDQPERIVRGGPLAIGDVVFSLSCDERLAPGLVFIHCDYGPVSRTRQAEVYRSLLEANMALYSGSAAAYTVSPDSGHVVAVDHRRLDECTPAALRALLGQMQAQAKAWRTDYSLFEAAATRGVPAAPKPAAHASRHSTARRFSSLRDSAPRSA